MKRPVHRQTSTLLSLILLFSLVGKEIQHKFLLESGGYQWFSGFVVSYNPVNKVHEVAYEGEAELNTMI